MDERADSNSRNVSLPTVTPSNLDMETRRLYEAAENNRLHQLPRELLYMIIDHLQGCKDIMNLSEALLGPEDREMNDVLGNIESLALRIKLMGIALDKGIKRIERGLKEGERGLKEVRRVFGLMEAVSIDLRSSR